MESRRIISPIDDSTHRRRSRWIIPWVAGVLGVLILALSACAPTHSVFRAEKAGKKKGVWYALPRTVITVEVPIKRVTYKEGRFQGEAQQVFSPFTEEEMFGRSLAEKKTVTFEMGDIVIKTHSEADPKEVFLVKIKDWNPMHSRKLIMALTESGLLTGATSEVEDKTIETFVKTLETVASIATDATMNAQTAALGALAPEALEVAKLTDAQAAARELSKLQAARLDLLKVVKPIAGVDLDTRTLVLEQLDAEIKKRLGDFLGTYTSKGWTARYEIRIEDRTLCKPVPLFDFDKVNGFASVTAARPSGVEVRIAEAVPDWAKRSGSAPSGPVVFTASTLDSDYSTEVKEANRDRRRALGFYFRVPGKANVAVQHNGVEIARKQLVVAQYGKTVALPRRTGSLTRSTYAFELYGDTGSLETITVTSQALDPDYLSRTLSAGASIAAAQAQRKAAEEAAKAAARKEREDRLLEFLNAIPTP